MFACVDCGQQIWAQAEALSSRCTSCGNIQYLPSIRKLQARRRITPAQQDKILAVRYRYQEEWQLWSKVVEHFDDLSYHQAYINQQLMYARNEQAARRYREHIRVHCAFASDDWQVKLCEQMLLQLTTVTMVQFEQLNKSRGSVLWRWLNGYEIRDADRYLYVLAGFTIVFGAFVHLMH